MNTGRSGQKRVKLPTGQYAVFPESMANEEIESQLRNHFGPPRADNNVMQSPSESPEMVNTIIGKMPKITSLPKPTEEDIQEMVNSAIGAPGFKVLGKVANYLRPGATVNEFMEKLSGGKQHLQDLGGVKTSPTNVAELGQRVQFARNSAAEEALAHKRPVFEALGEKQVAPEFKATEYMKEGKAHKGFKADLKEAHKEFKKDATLNNLDKLQRKMGDRIGTLKERQYRGTITGAEEDELFQLGKSRKHLLNDQEKFMKSQDPKLFEEYELFRNKWRENVSPYNHPVLSQMVREGGQTKGLDVGDIKNVFKNPEAFAEKVAEQLGPSGYQNILYNELQSALPQTGKELGESLSRAYQFGYEKYMTDEMRALAKELPKRYNAQKLAKNIGKGIAGTAALGLPVTAAILAASGHQRSEKKAE